MEILGSIKTYDWGTPGSKSIVAQLALKNDENFAKEFNESTPYAELWYSLPMSSKSSKKSCRSANILTNLFFFQIRMGDHVSGPSIVKATGEPLTKIIARDDSPNGGAKNIIVSVQGVEHHQTFEHSSASEQGT